MPLPEQNFILHFLSNAETWELFNLAFFCLLAVVFFILVSRQFEKKRNIFWIHFFSAITGIFALSGALLILIAVFNSQGIDWLCLVPRFLR